MGESCGLLASPPPHRGGRRDRHRPTGGAAVASSGRRSASDGRSRGGEGDLSGQGKTQMQLSLTCAANGDNYEAIEHCLQCLKLCRQLGEMDKEASCLFTLGTIYYEAGEVRQAVEAFEQCLVLRRKLHLCS